MPTWPNEPGAAWGAAAVDGSANGFDAGSDVTGASPNSDRPEPDGAEPNGLSCALVLLASHNAAATRTLQLSPPSILYKFGPSLRR